MNAYLPWLTLAALGAYHGINPAMGWLFAVGLGLQEQRRRAVVNAFAPIALGHALSIAMVVALLGVLQQILSPSSVSILSGGVLLVFGAYRIGANSAHPRWVGMRVGFRDLMAWSFLMSTAHGAGLMLAPVLLKFSAGSVVQPVGMDQMHGEHAEHMVAAGDDLQRVDQLRRQPQTFRQRRGRVGRLRGVVLADLREPAAAGVGGAGRARHEVEQPLLLRAPGAALDLLAVVSQRL